MKRAPGRPELFSGLDGATGAYWLRRRITSWLRFMVSSQSEMILRSPSPAPLRLRGAVASSHVPLMSVRSASVWQFCATISHFSTAEQPGFTMVSLMRLRSYRASFLVRSAFLMFSSGSRRMDEYHVRPTNSPLRRVINPRMISIVPTTMAKPTTVIVKLSGSMRTSLIRANQGWISLANYNTYPPEGL